MGRYQVNIIFKNFSIVAIATLVYALMGFNIMYPGDDWIVGKFMGFCGFGVDPSAVTASVAYNSGYTYWTDFLFQAMFAAATGSIVSGAVCERIKIGAFLVFSLLFTGIIYPIIGSWGWGGGFLSEWGFHDLAGSVQNGDAKRARIGFLAGQQNRTWRVTRLAERCNVLC